jgi:hypothetical protein
MVVTWLNREELIGLAKTDRTGVVMRWRLDINFGVGLELPIPSE